MRIVMIIGGLAAVALTGCGRPDAVSSYTIPKEDYSIKVAAGAAEPGHEGHGHDGQPHPGSEGASARPHVHWELPAGWEERKGDSMSVGRFRVTEGDKTADVSILPMPGAGRVPDLIDRAKEMWLEQLELPATNAVASQEVPMGGGNGKLYDIGNEAKGLRVMVGVVEEEGTMWFARISGDYGLVGKETEKFKGFLKSLDFHEEAHDAPAVEAKWPGAQGWTAVAPGQMVLAKYSVGGKAEVTVTSFPGDVGGMFANVNRWRGQMGLAPVKENEIATFTKETTLADGTKATAVELSGNGKVTYALVVSRGGNTWFYKMVGEEATVGAEKERLAEFAARAKS